MAISEADSGASVEGSELARGLRGRLRNFGRVQAQALREKLTAELPQFPTASFATPRRGGHFALNVNHPIYPELPGVDTVEAAGARNSTNIGSATGLSCA